jgi:hypothetical protein
MNWLAIATLYGTFGGFVVGSVLSGLHIYGRSGDQIAFHFCILGGTAFGLVAGLVLDAMASRGIWPANRMKPAKAIGILAILFIFSAIVLPAMHAAR